MSAKKPYNPSKGGGLQLGFFTPQSDWKPTPVSELPDFRNAKRIALDCETKDTELKELGPGPRRGGYTTGWAFRVDGDSRGYYLPMRHEGGGNLPEQEVLNYLRGNIKEFKGEIVGANLSYDLDYAANDGIEFHPDVLFRDIQIADPLIYELHRSYSLKNIGDRWGVKGKEDELLKDAARCMGLDPGAGMWRLHSKYVGAYAENDVDAPLKIYEKQRQSIDKNNLWQIFDLESRVLPVLVKLRRRGVRIDFYKLSEIEEWSLKEETNALLKIKSITGVNIDVGDVWKAGAVAPAFESVGITLQKTSTGAPQIDAQMLETVDHEIGKMIRHARKVNKIRTTFAASMRRYAVDGRIHCSFHQMVAESQGGDQKGVRYGRLSATDPNLQQQPSPDRDPIIAGEWRKIFIPEEGSIWGCNDYSQQEPRWTTHFASVMDLPKAREAAKRFRDDPDTDNHDMMTRLIYTDPVVDAWLADHSKEYKTNRSHSKNIYLGICYGQGGPLLCNILGKPTRWALTTGFGKNRNTEYFESRQLAWKRKAELGAGLVREVAGSEGQKILDRFDAEVPYVRALSNKASEKAQQTGFIRTIMGRRLHFSERDDGSYDWTHKALNRLIQGSSADQMKKALVDLDRAGHYIQLQVHDESDGSFASVEEALKAGEVMKESILEVCEPHVPFKVDTEVGPSWGELKGA